MQGIFVSRIFRVVFILQSARVRNKKYGSIDQVERRGQKMKKKQTFILEINDDQNQSWQGKVEWIQGQKRQSFRSVMELLRLIDSVVCGESQCDQKTM